MQTWEAILNEILELRKTGLLDGSAQAYNVLNEVENAVLPDWKEHGKKLLIDNGVGFEKLQSTGILPKKIEMLYQAMYAFAFGFCQVVKRCIADCTDPGEVMISVSKVYSLLLAEALETAFTNLLQLKLDQKEAEAAELLRQLIISRKKVESLMAEGVHARESQRAAERKLKETEIRCAAEVKDAQDKMQEYKGLYEDRLDEIQEARKKRDEIAATCDRLRKDMSNLEDDMALTVETYDNEVRLADPRDLVKNACPSESESILELSKHRPVVCVLLGFGETNSRS